LFNLYLAIKSTICIPPKKRPSLGDSLLVLH